MSNLAGLKRVDEHRLNDLRGRAQSKDPSLTEMDLLWLSVLEDRYALFLEEGMKALKALQPKDPKPSVASAPSNGSFPDSGSSSPVTHASSGSSFVGSLISLVNRKRSSTTVSSSSLPVQQETSRLCKHWSWVADNLVIGAIPFADMTVTDPSAHLIGLREQCRDRGTMVSLVVSALEFDEAASEDLREFASPREWELALGTTAFVHVGLPQDSNAKIALSYDDLAAACVQIHDAMVHRSKCVFVHCKAGLQRSWVIAVCYLVAHRNMTFDEANGLLSVVRPQFAPSPVQVEYAQGFEAYIRQLRAPLRSREDDDATYARLLAELLSLPPEYRKRLLRDMEHLT